MSRTTGLLVGGVVILAAGAVWASSRPRAEVVVMHLVDALDQAEQRPSPEAFSAVAARLDGVEHRAILATQQSRLTWSLDVPARAWLRVALALREDAWQIEGDGVLFQVGVSDGEAYIELFNLMVNPYRNPVDRAWHEVVLDLGDFSGRQVDVIFNTRASAPGAPQDVRGDFALWGEPRLVAR